MSGIQKFLKQLFIKKKESFYNLKSIKVVGLDSEINLEIEENLNFLKNTNIFFINKEIIKDQIDKYDFIENYNIFKSYPSKIILELHQAEFLARTIRNNETFLIGSNSKFIKIDITKESLPESDLMICRDCLIHLSFESIRLFFENFRKSK